MSSQKEQNDESEILFKMVQNRYGERLSPKELEEVRKGVERITETAEALRSVKLENWDEPFFVFKPYRREG
jgi:hypothetical protein